MISENPTPALEADPGPRATFLSKSKIKPGRWFRHSPRPEEPTLLGAVVKTLVGLAIGGLVYVWGPKTLAVLICVVSVIIGVVTLSSQQSRTLVGRFLSAVGRGLGWMLGVVMLTPIFLIGFTLARINSRLAGRDPLHLRDTKSQTFWLPADQDQRTVRHIRSLYATEIRARSSSLGARAVLVLALLVVAELVARSLGFGNPILYTSDALIDYYPAPNQETRRHGGLVTLNSYGMRAPEYELAKSPGTFRIFMIGDSTLWGGTHIDQADLYARLLDEQLDSKPGVNDVEVWNIAANGWGPFQESGYVEKFGAFDADVAIVCMPIADIYRGPTNIAETGCFTVDAPPKFALQEILNHLMSRSRQMIMGPRPSPSEEDAGGRGIAKYALLAKKFRDNGCEVMFAVLPNRVSGMTSQAYEMERIQVDQLRAGLSPLNVQVDLPVGVFKGHEADDIYSDQMHLRAAGHRVYAAYLKSWLEKQSAKLRAHRARLSATAAATEGKTQ